VTISKPATCHESFCILMLRSTKSGKYRFNGCVLLGRTREPWAYKSVSRFAKHREIFGQNGGILSSGKEVRKYGTGKAQIV